LLVLSKGRRPLAVSLTLIYNIGDNGIRKNIIAIRWRCYLFKSFCTDMGTRGT
jgi:hypothetical protein